MRRCKPERLIFLDESGSNIAMTRAHSWAPRGQRAYGLLPRNRGAVLTMIGALSLGGLKALMTFRGGTTLPLFRRFVRHHLAPVLHRGDVVVADNLAAHRDREAREIIESRGATLMFQPVYSPDLNPIEPAWSKVKTVLRGISAGTIAGLVCAVRRACRTITPADALGWFQHCGVMKRRKTRPLR